MKITHLAGIYFLLLITGTSRLNAGILPDSLKCTLVPETHLAGSRTADLTWHRISLIRKTSASQFSGMDEYNGTMGGVFPAVGLEYKKHKLQLSVASTLSTRILRPPGNIIVETADFFVDVFIDYSPAHWLSFRTGPGHTSQHLTDDAFEILGRNRSLNYVRDYWQLFAETQIRKYGTRVYAGYFHNYHMIIDARLNPSGMWQAGLETSPWKGWKNITPYLALDFKRRGEVAGATSFNVQTGIRFGNPDKSVFRLAFHHRSGIEDRGQFYAQHINCSWIGLWMDF